MKPILAKVTDEASLSRAREAKLTTDAAYETRSCHGFANPRLGFSAMRSQTIHENHSQLPLSTQKKVSNPHRDVEARFVQQVAEAAAVEGSGQVKGVHFRIVFPKSCE